MRFILLWLLAIPIFSTSQNQLKLEEIMAGNDFIGHQPSAIVWGPDNKTIYFKWQTNDDQYAHYYSVNNDKSVDKLSYTSIYNKPVNGYQTNVSKSAYYFQQNNSIYHFSEGENKLIYQSATPITIAKVIDNKIIIIQQKGAYFSYNHSKGILKQCIHFDSKSPEKKTPLNYLERQQFELFDFIKDEVQEIQFKSEIDSLQNLKSTPSFNIHKKSVGLFEIDSAQSFILFRLDEYPSRKTTAIEQNIHSSGYSERVSARPKVGVENPIHDLYWMNLKTKQFDKIDLTKLPGIYKKPAYLKLYEKEFPSDYKTPKAVIFTQIQMNVKGDKALIEVKSYDNKDRWIVIFDVHSKKINCIDHQHDEAWIGGPGISGWNMVPGNIGWLIDGKTIYYQSEKTGFSHLYLYDVEATKTTDLTKGNFEIYSAVPSKNGKIFYITSNKSMPGNRSFYHFEIKSKKWTPIFENEGNYEVEISPQEDQLAIRYSYKNKPWELYKAENAEKTKLIQITKSTTVKFDAYHWRKPKLITFKNQKNKTVYARLFKPEASKKNGAAIQFVHGAGYLQNAHNWWSVYYREYMFHNLLCDLGYTVLDIDYSASEGYGRDFRTSIYRHMGGQDLDDQIAGRQFLIDSAGIDAKKIGIYGGSYGGFITIMALLKYPGYFQSGAAIRSVTDWAHYNHAYTSNILNTPETDSLAYRRSSPIYFASNLADELLILHGMMDDNVQFQDVVRLNQRFIELGKKTFQMAIYPVEPHGFIKTSSWVDEYTRILKLFNRTLLD